MINLREMTHHELEEAMNQAAFDQTKVPLLFKFSLSSDGVMDLYRMDNYLFTRKDIENMVNAGWFEEEVLNGFDEAQEEGEEFSPFDYLEDTLANSDQLFDFMVERTFGEECRIIGNKEEETCVALTLFSPELNKGHEIDFIGITHKELVAKMEREAEAQTGIPFQFSFELTSDGNTDLFIVSDHLYTEENVKRLVEADWFTRDLLDAFHEASQANDPFDPFEYDEDNVGMPHQLFQFILEKTFGESSKVGNTEEHDEYVWLTLLVPVQ